MSEDIDSMTEGDLDVLQSKIQEWPAEDPIGLLVLVKSHWWSPDWGWHEEQTVNGQRYFLSTGGHSSNEWLVSALKHNALFWLTCWEQSRRGGHYIFLAASNEPREPWDAGK